MRLLPAEPFSIYNFPPFHLVVVVFFFLRSIEPITQPVCQYGYSKLSQSYTARNISPFPTPLLPIKGPRLRSDFRHERRGPFSHRFLQDASGCFFFFPFSFHLPFFLPISFRPSSGRSATPFPGGRRRGRWWS